jgi:hypothetical protein
VRGDYRLATSEDFLRATSGELLHGHGQVRCSTLGPTPYAVWTTVVGGLEIDEGVVTRRPGKGARDVESLVVGSLVD